MPTKTSQKPMDINVSKDMYWDKQGVTQAFKTEAVRREHESLHLQRPQKQPERWRPLEKITTPGQMLKRGVGEIRSIYWSSVNLHLYLVQADVISEVDFRMWSVDIGPPI
jgi:hypothetical protein